MPFQKQSSTIQQKTDFMVVAMFCIYQCIILRGVLKLPAHFSRYCLLPSKSIILSGEANKERGLDFASHHGDDI
jgi:hypothetical protein